MHITSSSEGQYTSPPSSCRITSTAQQPYHVPSFGTGSTPFVVLSRYVLNTERIAYLPASLLHGMYR